MSWLHYYDCYLYREPLQAPMWSDQCEYQGHHGGSTKTERFFKKAIQKRRIKNKLKRRLK